MNVIDIIVLIILLIAVVRGYMKGLIIQLFSLAAILAGIFGGVYLSKLLSPLLSEWFGWNGAYMPMIYFILIFLLLVLAVNLLAAVIEKQIKKSALSMPNRISGSIFSLIKTSLVLSMLLFLFIMINQRAELIDNKTFKESFVTDPMIKGAELIFDKLNLDISVEYSTQLPVTEQKTIEI